MGRHKLNRIKILQQYIQIGRDSISGHMILIEIVDDKPVATFFVTIPDSFHFYDEHYQYYPVWSN